MRAYMVIGAGYGDEGKGLTVEWLYSDCRQKGMDPLVVRYNGGTQAAHTVQYADGERIVWHNLNSATAQGAPTYLGRHFLVNPIGLMAELRDPAKARLNPVVTANPHCRVSLPVDMMLNQMIETRRSGSRHGSCGWGIGETVERSLDPDLLVTAADLCGITVEQVEALTEAYLAKRLPVLGVASLDDYWSKLVRDPSVFHNFVVDCHHLADYMALAEEEKMFSEWGTVIFEGAQGLGLDQDAEHFPHVTRSKTGSQWPLELLERAKLGSKLQHLEVLYVTRAYATRHGAGPLEREGCWHGCTVEDPTNVENSWQGPLRSAPLDLDVLASRIVQDMEWPLSYYSNALFGLVTTHLDAATEEYNCYSNVPGEPDRNPRSPMQASAYITSKVRVNLLMSGHNTRGMRVVGSTGPTKEDMKEYYRETKDMMGRAATVAEKWQLPL